MSESFLEMANEHFNAQELQVPKLPSTTPQFYRNLEERLDKRRAQQSLNQLHLPRPDTTDFSSNDFLSLGASGLIRMAFFDELARHPGFALGSTSSRLMDGNHKYVEELEQELAEFHGEETGLIFGSGFEANGSIFETIPSKGDVIVYDQLIHASIHHGMKASLADATIMFKHNNLEDFRRVLKEVREKYPLVREAKRTVLISIESVYSMDGDIAPVRELLAIAKEVFPEGQAQFAIDEAHSTGCIGPQGKGLIAELGLEGQIAIRLHTFGKSLACTGAIVMCNKTIKNILINYAKGFIYTTGPSFTTFAAMRGAFNLMKGGFLKDRQTKLQDNVRHFMNTITAHPKFDEAVSRGIISIPVLYEGGVSYKERKLLTHVVPICTRDHEAVLLTIQIQQNDYVAWPCEYPVVPKGESRVRLVFHANNSFEQCEHLSELVMEFAEEMMRVDDEAAADAANDPVEDVKTIESKAEAVIENPTTLEPLAAVVEKETSVVETIAAAPSSEPLTPILEKEDQDNVTSDSVSVSGEGLTNSDASTPGTEEVPTPELVHETETAITLLESVKKLDLLAEANNLPPKPVSDVIDAAVEAEEVKVVT